MTKAVHTIPITQIILDEEIYPRSGVYPKRKGGRWFQNDLNIFYLLQLIVKKYQNSFSIFYAKINRNMIGYFDSKVVLEPTSPFTYLSVSAAW